MPAKKKTVFFCQQCGFESAKWMGQCPGCKAWNSFAEEVVAAASKTARGTITQGLKEAVPVPLSGISKEEADTRADTHFS